MALIIFNKKSSDYNLPVHFKISLFKYFAYFI